MKRLVALVLVAGALVTGLAACGPPPLSGTTWKGVIGSTEVTVKITDETNYTSAELGDGSYSINWYDQVMLEPSGGGRPLKFLLDYGLMQGTVDGQSVTLTRQ